jgi:hypothetical protein
MSRTSTTTRVESSTKQPDKYSKSPETRKVPPKPNGRAPKQGREELEQRMLAKLAQSDLDEADAKLMGLKPCTEAQAAKLAPPLQEGMYTDGFQIPYFDPKGKKIADMYRYRNFETVIEKIHTNGFLKGGVTVDEIPKYVQPADTPPRVYFPPVGGIEWEKVMNAPSVPLIITEGEIKAACASKKVYKTLGLGGVWSYGSKARFQKLLPALQDFKWKGREVVIVFDSDLAKNRELVIAESRLARLLSDEGALVKAVRLPTLAGMEKTGFDDFLVKAGTEAFDKLLADTGLYPDLEEMYRLNEEMLLIKHPPLILFYPDENHPADQQWYRMRSVSEVTSSVMSDRKIKIPATTEGGRDKEVPATREWLGWSGRACADSVCYEPGQPQWIGPQFNIWVPWPYEPIKGNVKPMCDLFDALMQNAEPAHRTWLWQWFAYPIQYPGAKLMTAPILWGRTQGTGKSLLGKTIARVYGRNAEIIGSKQLKAEFNSWAQGKQFIVGDEITGNESREHADTLKALITEPTLQLNLKYLSEIQISNKMNFYMSSNHLNALYLSDEDRRYFVHEVPAHDLMKPAKFFDEYGKWLYIDPVNYIIRPESVAAVYWHLLNDVSVTGFDPFAQAPRTKALAAMALANRAPWQEWMRELVKNWKTEWAELRRISARLEGLGSIYVTTEIVHRASKLRFPDLKDQPTERQVRNYMAEAGFENVGQMFSREPEMAPRLWTRDLARHKEIYARGGGTAVVREFVKHFQQEKPK